jgi:flagellar hook-associated protein 2
MAGLALSGLASGVDTSGIVDQLMAIDRQAVTRLGLRKTAVQARSDNLGTVSTKLAALKAAAADLQAASLWADTQTVEASDPARLGVARTGGTGPGGYAVDVQRMASAARRTFAYTPQASDQTFTVAGKSFTVPAGATIQQVADQLNTTQGSPVYAAVVADPVAGEQLVISSRATGQGSVFTLSAAGFTEDAARARVTGLDALVSVDGAAAAEHPTNTLSGAIPGLTLTLKGVTASPVGVTVGAPGADQAAVKAKVKAFVTAYNDVVTTVRGFTDERPVAGAATATDAKKGQLFGDTGLLGTLTRLRQTVSGAVAGLGISTGAGSGGASTPDAKLGKLTLDETKLTAALADPDRLRGLLDGFATDVTAVVKQQIGSGAGTSTGVIAERVDASSRELRSLTAQADATSRRLDDKEKRLRAQFAAMETALQNAQTQQAWLAGQLASLAGS